MKIEIHQKYNTAYYEEFYGEWLTHRSKFRKWEDKIGYVSIGIGLLLFLFDINLKIISIGFILFGAMMIFEFHSSKNKWIKSRLQSKMNNESATLIFEEDKIQSIGPFTKLSSKWDFFNDAVETEKGLFLIPENGISIYLQKVSFENKEDLKRIIEKIKKQNA